MTDNLYDVIIIGGGPAGLSAAQYASRAKLKTIVLDKSSTSGALALSRKVENYPGLVEPVTGVQLLKMFRNQAIQFGAEYVEGKVVEANLESEIKEITTLENSYHGKSVIIATGSMGRTASIEGEIEFISKGVCYCATCDAALFQDQVVCVVGDSEEALAEAGVLCRFASKVYLIAPSKKIKVPEDHPTLSLENLHIMTGSRVISIKGSDFVEEISVKDIEAGETKEIQTDGIFIYLQGNKPIVDYLDHVVDLSDEKCILSNKMMETSIPGVYTAGDVSCVEVRQVVVAASQGCLAALSAEKYVHHRKRRKYDWAKS